MNKTNKLPNLKEQNARFSFRVSIRDREHFYTVVTWLNTNVGRGSDNWTMEGKIMKSLRQGVQVNPKVYIFRDDFDEGSALFVSLL